MKSFETHSTLNPTHWSKHKAVSAAKLIERLEKAYTIVFNEPVTITRSSAVTPMYTFKVGDAVRGTITIHEYPNQ